MQTTSLNLKFLQEDFRPEERSNCDFEPDSGNPTVRDHREALGNTAKEEIGTRLTIERVEIGHSLPKERCAQFLSQSPSVKTKNMGLDIYVGSFTRYYTGNWETIIQQYARVEGINVQVDRPVQAKPSWIRRLISLFKRPPRIDEQIEEWKKMLARKSGIPFSWNEEPDYEYFTDKPAWDCYGALLIWAAYEEQNSTSHPKTAEKWEQDPIYLAAAANRKSRYRHLLGNPEIWLPGDFEPFEAMSLLGDPIVIGSTNALAAELHSLNSRTWQANQKLISQWRMDGAEYGAPMEVSAQFGFAVVSELADLAVQHRLPLKLDY